MVSYRALRLTLRAQVLRINLNHAGRSGTFGGIASAVRLHDHGNDSNDIHAPRATASSTGDSRSQSIGLRRLRGDGSVGWRCGWRTALAPTVAIAAGRCPPAPALTPAEARMKSTWASWPPMRKKGASPARKGIEASADYIADVFKKAGLKPAPGADGYFQPFFISGGLYLKKDQFLAFDGPDGETVKPQFGDDFTPLAIGTAESSKKRRSSSPATASPPRTGPRNPGLDYDDYAGIDVKGKAVLILRREPQQHDEVSPFDGKEDSSFATFQHKAVNAFQHGAAAVILVNNLAGAGRRRRSRAAFHRRPARRRSRIFRS